MSAAAVNNDPLLFSVNGADVKVNDASVTTADVTSSNGVIHVVDQVLLPPVDVYGVEVHLLHHIISFTQTMPEIPR